MWAPKMQGKVITKKSEWLLYRPDLEAKHREYVEKRARGEEWGKQERIEDVVMFRQHQLAKMRRRRAINRHKATRSKSDLHPDNNDARVQAVLRRGEGAGVKDWTFYRRNGAVWTDLAHTPADRVHLVVTPQILQKDAQAALKIHEKLDQERAVREAVADMQRQRADSTRKLFRKRREERAEWLSATISKPVIPGKKRLRKHSASSRIHHLAQPKSAPPPTDPFYCPDFKGLLVADDTSRIMAQSAMAMHPYGNTSAMTARSQRRRSSVVSARGSVRSSVSSSSRRSHTSAGKRARPESAPATRRHSGMAATAPMPRRQSRSRSPRAAQTPQSAGPMRPRRASAVDATMSVSMEAAVPVTTATLHTNARIEEEGLPSPPPKATTTSAQRRRQSIRSISSLQSEKEVKAATRDIKSFNHRMKTEEVFNSEGPHKFSRQSRANAEQTPYDNYVAVI